MRYAGPLYRALNPVYAKQPLSGEGAALHGGRFNARSAPALYASLHIMTALREANQAGTFQPITLVSYTAEIARVFDGRDATALKRFDMSPAALADPAWRDAMIDDGEAPTQTFARRLADEGQDGLLVPSYAPGAREDDLNLVLWRWNIDGAALTVVDDEGRLTP